MLRNLGIFLAAWFMTKYYFYRDMPACRGQFHIQIMCPLSPVIILYFQNNYISAAAGHEETDIKQPKLHDHKTLKGLKLDELISKTSSIDYLSTSAHFWPSHVLCTACTKPVVHISRHHRYICLSYLHSYILMLFLHIFRHCYYFSECTEGAGSPNFNINSHN